jgi:hypothetical protein
VDLLFDSSQMLFKILDRFLGLKTFRLQRANFLSYSYGLQDVPLSQPHQLKQFLLGNSQNSPILSASPSPGPVHHEESGIPTSGLELGTLGESLLLDILLVGWHDERLLVGAGFGSGRPQS